MNGLLKQALGVQVFLQKAKIPFAFIGGIANALHGEPRVTLDADVLVLVTDEDLPTFIKRLKSLAKVRPQHPDEFALRMRVIPCDIPGGIAVDFILAQLDFEKELIRRAAVAATSKSSQLRVCTPEDLLILKLISTREKDRLDIPGILLRQAERLDVKYIRKWLKRFERTLDRSDLVREFNQELRDSK